MAVELFPHNQTTYGVMEGMFAEANRVAAIQPTGTGKTFLMLKWVEENPDARFLILSPSTEIFVQMRTYAVESNCTEILDGVRMLTYHSLLFMTDGEFAAVRGDKIILDEFHRIGAEIWGQRAIQLLNNNPAAQVFGTTATPIRYLDESRNMAEELFENNLAVEMTLGEAVRRKILPEPDYIPVWYDMDGKMRKYRKAIAANQNETERKRLSLELEKAKRQLEKSYGVSTVFQKHMPRNGKFIVFCRDREHLDKMQATLPKWLRKVNRNIRGYVSISAESDKDIQLNAFKGDNGADAIKLLYTIDRLNEGVHIKGLDGVIMLRPTISPIIYLQQMGRALAAGTKRPLVFDLVNNYQNLKTLGEGNVFEEQYRGGGEAAEINAFHIFDRMIAFNDILSEIDSLVYPDNEEIFERKFSLFLEYIAEFGETPPIGAVYKGVRIGAWWNNQKQEYRKGEMPEERVRRFEDAGLDLSNALEAEFERKFALLREYLAEFGKTPPAGAVYKGVRIGAWWNTQKQTYRKGKMPEERVRRFETAGVDLSNAYEAMFERKFALFLEYLAEFGKTPPAGAVYKGVRIGVWWDEHKQEYQKGEMPEERVRRFEDAGIDLSNALEAEFKRKFALLLEYIAEFGSVPVYTAIYKGVNIGTWWYHQKQTYRKGKMPEERVRRFEDAGIDLSNALEAELERKFALFLEYIAEFGKLPPSKAVYKGVRIGAWWDNQKQEYRKGEMPEERVRRFEDAGIDLSNALEAEFERKFALFLEYIAEFGKLPPSKAVYKGKKIGKWWNKQKQTYRKGEMPEERVRRFEDAGGDLTDGQEAEFERKFALFLEYIAEFGKLPPHRAVYKRVNIGIWWNTQKQTYRKGKMPEERVRRFEDAGIMLSK